LAAKKGLVTGAAGFIASHVVDALIRDGYEVVAVDDLTTGRRENVNPSARFIHMDIRDPRLAQVFDEERPNYVNHHAAQISIQTSLREAVRDADINILGSLLLLEYARKSEVEKFIYISSGGAIYGEPRYLPCDEEHPIQPLSPYGASKCAFEPYLFMYKELYGLDFTTLRYANIYGPRQDPFGEAGVVAIFTERMLQGKEVIINGSGEQERDFVYVDDAVKANLLSLERGGGEVFNIGSGIGTSVNRMFALLKEITGYERPPTHGPPKEGEVFKIYLSAAKAREGLGWRPKIPLEEGLAGTVAYFKEQAGEEAT